LCDTDGDCDSATVTITVSAADELPVAADDSFSTAEDTAYNGTVAGNDTLSGDGGNTWSKLTDPTNGTVLVNSDGTFTYTPTADWSGTDSFTYQLCDTDGDCDSATVTITVNAADDLPVAADDSFSTAEDTAYNGTVAGNDTLSGDGGNTWSKLTDPTNGTVLVNSDGTFTYTPTADWSGTDSFTYQLCDTDGDCDSATVTITVSAADDLPVAADDSFSTAEDTAYNGTVAGNDTLSGDGGNTWSKLTDPTNGTVLVNSDGTFTYTPTADWSGTDSFTYQLCDTDGDCDSATVTITVSAADDLPVAADDSFSTAEDTAYNGTVAGNDTLSGDAAIPGAS